MSALSPALASAHAGGRPDTRGNTADRARHKAWLLSPAAPFGGNGWAVPCHHCGRTLTAESMEVDRFPICGHDGGSYRRGNIVPACIDCNRSRSRRGAVCRMGGQLQIGLDLVVKEVAHAG